MISKFIVEFHKVDLQVEVFAKPGVGEDDFYLMHVATLKNI